MNYINIVGIDSLMRHAKFKDGHFGTAGFYFVDYLVNGCRYFPNIFIVTLLCRSYGRKVAKCSILFCSSVH